MADRSGLGLQRIPRDLELAPDRGTYSNDLVTQQLLALLKLLSGFSDTRFHNDGIWLLWLAAWAHAHGGAVYVQWGPGETLVPLTLVGYPPTPPPGFPNV